MEITEKVAYLKGLMDGLDIDKTTKEGKTLCAMLDILEDVAYAVSDLSAEVGMVSEQVEMLGEDLEEVQEDLYEDEDEGCGCGRHHHGRDDEDGYDGELYEVTCPACGDVVCVDEDMLDEGEIACPGCGETLEFDLDGLLGDEQTEK